MSPLWWALFTVACVLAVVGVGGYLLKDEARDDERARAWARLGAFGVFLFCVSVLGGALWGGWFR